MVIRPEELEGNEVLHKHKQHAIESKQGACYDASGQLIVPVVDLSKSEEECVATARDACETLGFFYLAGHGVPQHVMDNVLKAAREFFKKDAATKAKFRAPPHHQPYGYKHCVEDNVIVDAATQTLPDQREIFRIVNKRHTRDLHAALEDKALETYPDDEELMWFADNQLSEEWKGNVQEYYDSVLAMSSKLHRVIALSLDLPGDYFVKHFNRSMDMLAMHHCLPTQSNPEEGKVGLGQHTDFGMVTVLLNDGVPGLQVCKDKSKPNSEREWIDVNRKPGMFIINVADLLERWSNGRYLSNLHRVVNKTGAERISLAFVHDPYVEDLISPIGKPKKYEDIIYGKFLKTRYDDISESYAKTSEQA